MIVNPTLPAIHAGLTRAGVAEAVGLERRVSLTRFYLLLSNKASADTVGVTGRSIGKVAMEVFLSLKELHRPPPSLRRQNSA